LFIEVLYKGSDNMRIKSLERQMKRDMKEALALGFNPVVTLRYDTAPPGTTGDVWSSGIPWQYENITVLQKIVSPYSNYDEKFGNVGIGKSLFYFGYDVKYDFRGKKNFKILWDNRIYNIDRIIPDIPLSDLTYLYYVAIEK
jgi:hypothetical protein